MPTRKIVNATAVFPDYIVRQLQQRLKGKGMLWSMSRRYQSRRRRRITSAWWPTFPGRVGRPPALRSACSFPLVRSIAYGRKCASIPSGWRLNLRRRRKPIRRPRLRPSPVNSHAPSRNAASSKRMLHAISAFSAATRRRPHRMRMSSMSRAYVRFHSIGSGNAPLTSPAPRAFMCRPS